MADPNQLFVISAIRRAGIADDLNGYLEVNEQKPSLLPDDDRLTDAICQEYAEHLGELTPDLGEDVACDLECEIQEEILVKLGFTFDDEEEDDDA